MQMSIVFQTFLFNQKYSQENMIVYEIKFKMKYDLFYMIHVACTHNACASTDQTRFDSFHRC